MNRIVDTVLFRENIIELWHECFGDERKYVEFFLDNCPNKVCIGYVEDGRLISMLFLLNGNLNGIACKYIYAACTAKKERKKGLMGSLIEYSKIYCIQNAIDFIFLVPAEERLYSYYSRFGFLPKMKRCESVIKSKAGEMNLNKIEDVRTVSKIRLRMLEKIDCFCFDEKTTEYSVAEFIYTGGEIFHLDGENETLFFAVRDGNDVIFKEFLTAFYTNITNILNLFENFGSENVYIRAPIVYNDVNIGGNCTKCGMLFPVTDTAKKYIHEQDAFYAGMYLD